MHLPHALAVVWQQMEYLASKRFGNFKELAGAVNRIPPPADDWCNSHGPDQSGENHQLLPDPIQIPSLGFEAAFHQLREQRVAEIPIDAKTSAASENLPTLWSCHLHDRGMGLPQAFFIGGGPAKQFVLLYARSLQSADFVRLWSI